jgi:hypothetical protein
VAARIATGRPGSQSWVRKANLFMLRRFPREVNLPRTANLRQAGIPRRHAILGC